MDNLQTLLSKSDVQQQNQPKNPTPKQHNVTEVLITVKIPVELDEWIRDFQYSIAADTGNFKFSYKDAVCKIIREHSSKHKAQPRPASIRAAERKKRR